MGSSARETALGGLPGDFSASGVWSRVASISRAVVIVVAWGACASPKSPPAAKPPVVAPPSRQTPRPICGIETAVDPKKPLRDRVFPPQNWFVLMLHAYRSTGEIARPLNDCSGTPVAMDVDGCGGEPAVTLTPTALTPQDLVVTPLGDARRLVWAITERLSDGQAQGPVAIAEVEVRGIAVRALGVLRAYPENISLRLEKLGGGTVLIADGQRCDGSGKPESCERAIRVVPLMADQFVSKALVDDKGACLGTSLLPVRTRGRIGRSGGTKYELEASVTFGGDTIVIRENLALTQAPRPRGAQDLARDSFVARLQLERQVALRGGRLVTDGPSLLGRWLAQHGADASVER